MHLSAPSSSCPEEHPFAPFVRTLGRGRRGARSLEREEARTALGMILDGEVDPLQTGAFLMLLRVKEETAEEIAGFVQAARERAQLPEAPIRVDLDWPTYAGKRQQPPWYLLSALLLTAHGHRVLMHGCEPHALGCSTRMARRIRSTGGRKSVVMVRRRPDTPIHEARRTRRPTAEEEPPCLHVRKNTPC